MDERTLQLIDYDIIIKYISSFASTDMAKEKILSILPSNNKQEITYNIEMLKESIDLFDDVGCSNLSDLADLRDVFKRLKPVASILDENDFLKIKVLLKYLDEFSRIAKKTKNKYPHLNLIFADIWPQPSLLKNIERIIQPDGSINDRATPELKKIRDARISKREFLLSKLESAFNELPEGVKDIGVTIRQGRYVLPLRTGSNFKGIILDQSDTGKTIFIEPEWAVEQNNELFKLEIEELAEIRRILFSLTQQTRERIDVLVSGYKAIIEIDILQAKYKLYKKWNASIPVITDKKEIVINKGYHPVLLMKLPESDVVPLDLEVNENEKVLLISGPNAGGKTVALKCIGILSVLAHCGFPIPADKGTKIPFFDGIYIDIGDAQSLEESLSTFSGHIKRIVSILNMATPDSLILIDEIGIGTDPKEGSSLAFSILKYFRDLGCKTIATTHFSKLKALVSDEKGMLNCAMEFDLENFKPTYRLIPGIPGVSYGLEMAEKFGIPESFIKSSKELLGKEADWENLLVELHSIIKNNRI